MSTMIEKARSFLELPRFAVVGVSRDAKDFSRHVLRELVARGRDVVLVHDSATEIDGRRCFARFADVEPKVEAALFFTRPEVTTRVVREAIDAGVQRVWMHRGAGRGAESPDAIAACAERGVEVVWGLCPFMALPNGAWPHRLHGFFRARALERRARILERAHGA
jgi:predicted CoA-binding protein